MHYGKLLSNYHITAVYCACLDSFDMLLVLLVSSYSVSTGQMTGSHTRVENPAFVDGGIVRTGSPDLGEVLFAGAVRNSATVMFVDRVRISATCRQLRPELPAAFDA